MKRLLRPSLLAGFLLIVIHQADAGNAIVTGKLYVEPPRLHWFGIEWDVEDDDNRNATVTV